MKIGILGSGNVGQTLAIGFLKLGYEVMLGTRNTQKEEVLKWSNENPTCKIGTFADTADFGDVLFLCTIWSGTESAINLSGVNNFKNKILVDVVNPLEFSSGVPKLAIGFNDSAGEQIQKLLPEAKVVKAFNIITASYMTNGMIDGAKLDMFIAGNDFEAKKIVTGFLDAFNWNTHDLGNIEQSRLLEPFAMLWITHGVVTGNWSHAFKLVGR